MRWKRWHSKIERADLAPNGVVLANAKPDDRFSHRDHGASDAVPHARADGSAHAGSLHSGAVVCRAGVLDGGGRRMLLDQRFVRGDWRRVLSWNLRRQPVRVLHEIDEAAYSDPVPKSATVRIAGANTRDSQAVRPLLPRPHARADARSLVAPDDPGSVRSSDSSAEPATDISAVCPAVALAVARSDERAPSRAFAGSDSEPKWNSNT